MQGQWPRSHAVVTQLGECQTEDLEVAGSSPARPTQHEKRTSGSNFSIGRIS